VEGYAVSRKKGERARKRKRERERERERERVCVVTLMQTGIAAKLW
jgi:hypothetical protein